jgi:hypothetical protein
MWDVRCLKVLYVAISRRVCLGCLVRDHHVIISGVKIRLSCRRRASDFGLRIAALLISKSDEPFSSHEPDLIMDTYPTMLRRYVLLITLSS